VKANNRDKDNSFLLSGQVRKLLAEKGYSNLFNWNDYRHFKKLTKGAFNQAFEIADFFISEAHTNSDFSEYVF